LETAWLALLFRRFQPFFFVFPLRPELEALLFLADIGSLFDVIGGILLILSLSMTLPPLVFFVAAVLVGLKGMMSLFA